MTLPGLPPPKPIPLKERAALVFVERAQIDVKDGAFVAIDKDGVRTHIPIGGIACMMLEPGARITHAAVALAARTGTLITWVGEAGVRLYSAGQPGGARSDRLLWQARLALDPAARLRVVRKMYALRFGVDPPAKRSIAQLRGIEGQRVRHTYKLLAQRYGVSWKRRSYDPGNWAERRCRQPLSVGGYRLPARTQRGGGSGGGIRTGHWVLAFRQAAQLRL